MITYGDGSQETTTVTLKVTKAAPTAPTVGQWQNGNLKVTPDGTNGGDRIEIPLASGDTVLVKKGTDGTWTVEGNHPDVKVREGSIEVPANQVGDSVTVTAKVGEGDLENSASSTPHTKQSHSLVKKDIIKKPTDTLSGEDLHTNTGVVGVRENDQDKPYGESGITSVTSVGTLPKVEADTEKQVDVLVTYGDGSQETTTVTLKVAPAAPNVTVNVQDGATGDVTLTIKRHDDTNYPDGSVVTVPGIDETFKVKDGIITIKNEQLKEQVQTGKVIVTEGTKLPAETDGDKVIPAKKVVSATPTFTVGTQNPQTGNVEVTVDGVPEGTKVKLPGIASEKVVTGGKVELTNNELPENPTTGKGIAQEDGKLPKEGTSDITIPGKLTSAKGEPATEFEVTIPLPIVVPDPEHLTPKEKTELEKKVKKSNPNMDVKVDDKGNVTVTEPKTGQSKVIPVKDLTVKDFTPVKPTDKVPVKDKAHLTPEEKKQVEDNVKAKNPGKEVTVGEDGTAAVKDPNTGITHSIPGTELVNQDFTPVKPTDKVPVKDKAHLTPEEKKQVADKVKDKNPGKDVTVGDDGTATVTDPTTGISHTIPGTDLVNQDFEPVKPTEKVPVKDPSNLTNEEQDKVKKAVEKANPGKDVTVDSKGNATVKDPRTKISHEIPNKDLIMVTGKGDSTKLDLPSLIITKWIDENGNELKPADAKAPSVPGEANEAYEHGEIEGYVFVRTETKGDVVTHIFRKVSPVRPTGDGQQRPATPSDDTNPRPDTATPAEVPATQPTEQPSQTVEVPAQLPNEVSETDSSVSQPQAVLPNTGTQEDRATGAFGLLSLLGALGLLFAKKKKDDEEEA